MGHAVRRVRIDVRKKEREKKIPRLCITAGWDRGGRGYIDKFDV